MNLFGKLLSKTPSPSPVTGNKGTGELGEEVAKNFLIELGYQIVELNFRCKGGEVDIIGRDPEDKSIVFIEVKARRGLSYGVPQLAVTPFKQRQISKAALTWLSKNRMHDTNARFDVIAILLHTDGQHAIDHIKNAFDVAY
ncbi:MAG: YraN family protein [Geobacteraceae bacterium]|nr:YraN family protein [Geobacteraceae bacterium]NTW80801.1 YraN family protein [Geobacteraceae bacterium]